MTGTGGRVGSGPVVALTMDPAGLVCAAIQGVSKGFMEYFYQAKGARARLARPEDNASLCELFRSVHLGGALDITQERDPDFFAMLERHLGDFECVLLEDDSGNAVGCSTLVRRPGWFEGEVINTGYLCDLRVLPSFRGGRHVPRVFAAAMDRMREHHGTELFNTVIFDANKRAVAALTGESKDRSARRAELPLYRPMTPFQMTSVQFTTQKPAPARLITEATPRDLDELAAFLAVKQRERVLGECLDADRFLRRLGDWPGFELGDFLLSRDSVGRINGCVAPWDTSSFKRTRVLGYHGQMAWIRRAYNLAATIRRFPKLPEPGDCFRFWFLTHLEVADDEPAIFRDLIRAAYRRYRGKQGHFLSAMLPRGSRLEAAVNGFTVNRTAMTLYAVHPRDSRFKECEFRTMNPGFEMALS